ncbi:hypothetical protein NDU88_000906 [Pleurodeles waltl]|uniref:Uncharacterized protein n=1 Tax=Pleurodeles waltl TaxID=8319 RepID=A0AAV7U602_PLEWA|nr:hypothetical protein NDU88_000906 [Pleurodeles waltl]
MRRARARVLNGRRRPLRDAVSEGQKKGRAFLYNNRALNTQVSQCNDSSSADVHSAVKTFLLLLLRVQEMQEPGKCGETKVVELLSSNTIKPSEEKYLGIIPRQLH